MNLILHLQDLLVILFTKVLNFSEALNSVQFKFRLDVGLPDPLAPDPIKLHFIFGGKFNNQPLRVSNEIQSIMACHSLLLDQTKDI